MRDLKALEIHVEVIGSDDSREMGGGTMYVEEKVLDLIKNPDTKVITIEGKRFIKE